MQRSNQLLLFIHVIKHINPIFNLYIQTASRISSYYHASLMVWMVWMMSILMVRMMVGLMMAMMWWLLCTGRMRLMTLHMLMRMLAHTWIVGCIGHRAIAYTLVSFAWQQMDTAIGRLLQIVFSWRIQISMFVAQILELEKKRNIAFLVFLRFFATFVWIYKHLLDIYLEYMCVQSVEFGLDPRVLIHG